MACINSAVDAVYDDGNFAEVERAIQEVAAEDRLSELINTASIAGKYGTPSKRLNNYIQDPITLVGKNLEVQDIYGGDFTNIPIKTITIIDANTIAVNDTYVLDMETGVSTDGKLYSQILGSEDIATNPNFTSINEISGTISQVLEKAFLQATRMDGDKLDPLHREHLEAIVKKYQTLLLEAGADIEVNVKFFEDLDKKNNTRGSADINTGTIQVILGNQRTNSATEILAHELQHVIIRNAIERNPLLKAKIEELRKAMRSHLENEFENGYDVFLEGLQNPTTEDINNAKKRWKYIFGSESAFPADEFLAYATTNKQLMKELEITELPNLNDMKFMNPVNIKPSYGKLKTRLLQVLNKLIEQINNVYRIKKGSNAKELALNLLNEALIVVQRHQGYEEQTVYKRIVKAITTADKKLARWTNALDMETKSYAEYLAKKEKKSVRNAVKKLWRIKALNKVRSVLLQNNLLSSMTRNSKNPDVAKFYEMFRKSRALVEERVVAIKQTTANLLGDEFGLSNINIGLRRAAKRILVDIDAAALGTIQDIKEYLENSSKVTDEYTQLTKGLNNKTIKAIESLANLLVHNKTTMLNGYVNAAQIAFSEEGSVDDVLINKIDKAISLKALEISSSQNKNLALEALNQDSLNGFERALELKREDDKKILEKAYGGDKMYEVKGAKQEHYVGDKAHYLVDAKEMKELVKAGMHNVGKHNELSRVLRKDIYMVIGDSLETRYTEGLMSIVQLKNEGDSLKHVLMELSDMTEKDIEELVDNMASESGFTDEALIPERSGNGNIYDYKIRIPHEAKHDYLGLENDIIQTVASTVSNLTHKQEAMLNNKASLTYLTKFYNKYKTDPEMVFIEVSKNSTGKAKEYWDIIPNYLKSDINKHMNGTLMIEQSFLVDYFGYKDVSIINAPWIKNKKTRQVIARKFEKIVTELSQNWKHFIVTKTPAVFGFNMFSNMIVGIEHTKDTPIEYLTKFKNYWGLMNEYQKIKRQILEMQIKRDSGLDISEEKLAQLQNDLKNNPMHPIMKDGQYNAILEDINTEWYDNEGILESKLNDLLNTTRRYNELKNKTNRTSKEEQEFKKLSKKTKNGQVNSRAAFKTVVDAMYLRKDNIAHDSIMKLTTYSDIINKMIILEGMRKDSKTGELTQDMLNYVDQLHVNYSYLDNRYIKYANDTLFLAFTKYFFRVFPAMMKMTGQLPVTTFLVEGMQGILDFDFETPWDQFYTPIDSLFNKVGGVFDIANIAKGITIPVWIR